MHLLLTRNLRALDVGTRIALIVGVLTLIAIGIGLLGLNAMETERKRLETVYRDRTVALVDLANITYSTLAIRRQIGLAQVSKSKDSLNQILDRAALLQIDRDRAWDNYYLKAKTKEELALVATVDAYRRQLAQSRNTVIAAFLDEGIVKGNETLIAADVDNQLDKFHSGLSTLINLQAQIAASEFSFSQEEGNKLQLILICALILCAGFGICSGFFLVRSIVHPLNSSVSAANAIARGDLNYELIPTGPKEMRNLLHALLAMQVALRSMQNEVKSRVKQLEDMSNGLPLAVFQMRASVDGLHQYNFVGQKVLDILGVTEQEMLADPSSRWRYVHPDDIKSGQATVADLMSRAATGEVGLSGEMITRVMRHGETRLIYSAAYVVKPSAQGEIAMCGYYQDVTEERRKQNLLQSVLDEYPAAIFVKTLSGSYILTNKACKIRQDKTDQEVFPPDIAAALQAVDQEVISTCGTFRIEEEIPVDGIMRTFLTTKFPLMDEDGLPYALCGISNDITVKRATEEALRSSDAYNRVLFQESHVPMIVIEPVSGQFLDCNLAAVSICGFTKKDELIGKTTLDVSAPCQYDGIDSPIAWEHNHVAALGQSINMAFEWRYQRPDGVVWDGAVHQSSFIYKTALLGLYTIEDITVRKMAEAAIRSSKETAEAAARVKSDFLAVMSHEIRTPLNAILGNLELLTLSNLPRCEADRVKTIVASSRTLLEIIDDILDFTKIDSGNLQLESIDFDLVTLAGEVVSMFAPAAQAKDVEIFFKIHPRLATQYHGDPTRIRQIVVNLLSNALKFTENGFITVTLDLSAREDKLRHILISISDTGIGMSTSLMRELFAPFKQGDSSISRRYGGTGLGLALCNRLTELMGGTISVSSKEGYGSVFAVNLPLRISQLVTQDDKALEQSTSLSLLCISQQWQSCVIPLLQEWEIGVNLIDKSSNAPVPDAPLLIFGDRCPWSNEQVASISKESSWIIWSKPDGPHTMCVIGKQIYVSCYALNELKKILIQITTGQWIHSPTQEVALLSLATLQKHQHFIRALVAEDHPANRALMHEQLQTLGYQADFAENGLQALDLFSNSHYDIVLTDLAMPVMDGYELARSIRRKSSIVPILAVTAHTADQEYQLCVTAGIDHLISKPFSLSELDAALNKLLNRNSAQEVPTETTMPVTNAKPQLPTAFFSALVTATEKSLLILEKAVDNGDYINIKKELHSIKGGFSMAQKHDIAISCEQLEMFCNDHDLNSVYTIFHEFKENVVSSLNAIRKTSVRMPLVLAHINIDAQHGDAC